MFAIVNIAGFQQKVSEGDTLTVPLLDTEADKKVTFSEVLAFTDDEGAFLFGAPFLAGASVEATVLEHGRDRKIRIFKMRRRKRYMRTQGHRQHFTKIKIGKISVA